MAATTSSIGPGERRGRPGPQARADLGGAYQNTGGMVVAHHPPVISPDRLRAVGDHWITDNPRAPAVLYFVVTPCPKAVLTTDDPVQVPVPKTPVVA